MAVTEVHEEKGENDINRPVDFGAASIHSPSLLSGTQNPHGCPATVAPKRVLGDSTQSFL